MHPYKAGTEFHKVWLENVYLCCTDTSVHPFLMIRVVLYNEALQATVVSDTEFVREFKRSAFSEFGSATGLNEAMLSKEVS